MIRTTSETPLEIELTGGFSNEEKDFVTLIMSAAGLPVLPAMLLVRRKMDGKPAIVFNGKGKTRRRAGGANGGRQTYRQAVMDRLFDPCRLRGMGQFF